MSPSNDSDDKPPQNRFQENQPRKKRRRSSPLSPLMKINPYVAFTLAVTLTIALSLTATLIFNGHIIVAPFGRCNGVKNCQTSTTNNFHFPGVADRQLPPQAPRSPQIDTPRQPTAPTQQPSVPDPTPTPPGVPVPTGEPVTVVPAQPISIQSAPGRAPIESDYYNSPSRSIQQSTTQPDYVYSSSRPNLQPPQPTPTENRYPQQPSGDYSDPPSVNTASPSISYSTTEVTAEPSRTINPKEPEQESHQTSILEQLTPNNRGMGSSDDIPEPPATAGILAIMGFFGWITKRMQPQDSEDEE
jgi:hypothetical protein